MTLVGHTMTKKIILVTNKLPGEYFSRLESNYKVEIWDEDEAMPREKILKKFSSGNVVALVCSSGDRIDAEVIDASTTLKVIATVSVGFDHIDLKKCKERKIQVGYTPNVLTDAVAELAIGLLLATTRRILEANRMIMAGHWPTPWSDFYHKAGQIKDSTVGVVGGSGRVGQAILERLTVFRPGRLLYSDAFRRPEIEAKLNVTYTSLETLLKESDYVLLAVSLNEATFHLISSEQFDLMKPTAILINISRGAVVDQVALVEALRKKQIRSAGLDVLEKEPIDKNDPLLSMDNVVVLPHIGSATWPTRNEIIRLAAANIKAGLEDRPLPAPVPM